MVDTGLYPPIHSIEAKKRVGTLVAMHLYFFRSFAYQSDVDETNNVFVVQINNIQRLFYNINVAQVCI